MDNAARLVRVRLPKSCRLLSCLACVAWPGLAWQSAEAAPVLRVTGVTQLEAHARAESGELAVEATIRDDRREPLAAAKLRLAALDASGKVDTEAWAGGVQAKRCDGTSLALSVDPSHHTLELSSDHAGHLCLRLSRPAVRALRLSSDGTSYLAPASLDLAVEPAGSLAAVLSFDNLDPVVDLGRQTLRLRARLRETLGSSPSEPEPRSALRGRVLALADEQGRELARATTDAEGVAHLDVGSEKLGPPGRGELRLRLDGPERVSPLAVPIVRRATVELSLASPPQAVDPERGASLEVNVGHPRGVVREGLVEAVWGGTTVGAAPVREGQATLEISLPAAPTRGERSHAELLLRFQAASPWWEAGPPLAVDLPLARKSWAWAYAVTGLVLALGAWIVWGWRRVPLPSATHAPPRPKESPSGKAAATSRAAVDGSKHYVGVVLDAHDGLPIEGAEVRILTPSLKTSPPKTGARTDLEGRFELQPPKSRREARLRVEAPRHVPFEVPLPKPGWIEIELVTRRRHLLDRLVDWAQRQGAPYDAPPEPTPAQIAGAAKRGRTKTVEEWASEVERAAYDREPVDAEREARVRSREPNQVGQTRR